MFMAPFVLVEPVAEVAELEVVPVVAAALVVDECWVAVAAGAIYKRS
jgi:hypothetical protein